MTTITFHRAFTYDPTVGLGWREIFADGFSYDVINGRGAIVSSGPNEWVFRGTQFAEDFSGWTVTLKPPAGATFGAPGSYSRIPTYSYVGTVELRDPAGQLVMTLSDIYPALFVGNIRYTTDLFSQNDTFHGSSGADVFHAHWGRDVMNGGGGDDQLSGGGGEDVLHGGEGADNLDGGDGDDQLDGGAGDDVLNGGSGNDILYWSEGSDQLDGGDGHDQVDFSRWSSGVTVTLGEGRLLNLEGAVGSAFDDVISFAAGHAEAVTLDGRLGDDILTGGSGDDRIRGETSSFGEVGDDLIFGGAGDDELLGQAGDDELHGEDGDDRLVAERGHDRLFGGAGNDILLARGEGEADHLEGGDGADELWLYDGGTALGGDGDDVVHFGWGFNLPIPIPPTLVDGGEGFDRLTISTVASGRTYVLDVLAADGTGFLGFESVHLAGGETVTLQGGARAEELSGGGSLRGGGGDDVLRASVQMWGEEGDDVIHVRSDTTTVVGGDGSDLAIFSGDRADYLFERSGSGIAVTREGRSTGVWEVERLQFGTLIVTVGETFEGTAAAETIVGTSAADFIDGLGGDDLIDGGDGHDFALSGGEGADIIRGGRGDDFIYGYASSDGSPNYHLPANADVGDQLYGEAGDDEIFGGRGDDVLDGGEGDDVLHGGLGADTLTGGEGRDVFRIDRPTESTSAAPDRILDFVSGEDLLDLSGALWGEMLLVWRDGRSEMWFSPDANGTFQNLVHIEGRIQAADIRYAGPGLTVRGTDEADEMIGGALAERLQGEGGDDLIIGGGGGDTLTGGAGADRFAYRHWTDSALSNADLIRDFQTGLDRLDLTGIGSVTVSIVRGGFGSTVYFTSTTDAAAAGRIDVSGVVQGADLLGFMGGVYIHASAADDELIGSAGDDFLVGGSGANQLRGGGGHDDIQGGEGDDWIDGGEGDDLLSGGAGQDRLEGGAGWDTASFFGSANDYAIIRDGDRFIVKGQDGFDIVSGVEVLRFHDRDVDLTLIVCDPDGLSAVAKGAEAPLTQPPTLLVDGPLVLPGPDVQVGRFVEVWRMALDDFMGRDPHRLVQPADVDWIW